MPGWPLLFSRACLSVTLSRPCLFIGFVGLVVVCLLVLSAVVGVVLSVSFVLRCSALLSRVCGPPFRQRPFTATLEPPTKSAFILSSGKELKTTLTHKRIYNLCQVLWAAGFGPRAAFVIVAYVKHKLFCDAARLHQTNAMAVRLTPD